MKILMLHNRYRIRGGEEESTEAEITLLKKNGIDVDVVYVDNGNLDQSNLFKIVLNTFWSNHHFKDIKKKIKANNYDIVHVQNFFPILSPSIFYACKYTNTKVVMSVRNYRLICPNALLYVNNAICTDCVGKTIPYPSIKKKCYRENTSATATVAAMLTFHNILKTWSSKINGLICTSEFVKSQMLLGGYQENQLFVKSNFIFTDIKPNYFPQDYYIYVGRLSVEKGVDVLLKAFILSERKLIIIGDGPLKPMVLSAIHFNPNIKYLGKKSLLETYNLIADARALIQPSKCHETFGRTIIEAFAHGTPVIAANLGGMTELVVNGKNGFLFDPYQDNDLLNAIHSLESSIVNTNMREQAYNTYLNDFLPSDNLKGILAIYNTVLSR